MEDEGQDWKPAKHFMLINRALLSLTARKIRKLMINMPSQHGKTDLCAKNFIPWYLSHFPNHKVLYLTYNLERARINGKAARGVVERMGGALNIAIDPEQNAQANWGIFGYEGGMLSAGMGGGVTGNPANLIVIDDPIKNQKEAFSALVREDQFAWYRMVAKTRIDPNGIILLIMNRWHLGDLSGKIIEHDAAGRWNLLCLEAVCDRSDDPIGRRRGEVLWPEVRTTEFIQEQREDLGSYGFNAMYQQNPMTEDGLMVKKSHFGYYRNAGDHFVAHTRAGTKTYLHNDCTFFQTCDTAQETGKDNDHTAVVTFALTPDNHLLIYDVLREKIGFVEQYEMLKNQRLRFEIPSTMQAVEKANAGASLIQLASHEGNPFKILLAKGSKQQRFQAASVWYENGKILHRIGAEWLSILEQEVTAFPAWLTDDIVDCIAYAVLLIAEGKITPKMLGEITFRVGSGATGRDKRGRRRRRR